MAGEQGRAVVDAIPREDAGLAEPAAVAHRLQSAEAAPITRWLIAAPGRPEHATVELGERVIEAEHLADLFLEAGRAIVVGAGADQRAARLEQAPAARDVGEVLLLVLGQQHKPHRPRPVLDSRRRVLQLQEVRPRRLLAGDVRERRILGAQKERSLWGERSCLERVGEGAAGLAHGTRTARPMTRPLRRSCSAASASSSLRLMMGTGSALPAVTRSIISFISAGVPVTEPMIWLPVKANIGIGIEKVPPNRPTTISRPPRPRARQPNCALDSAPTKSMAAPTPVPLVRSMICLRASLSRGSTAAQAPLSSASFLFLSSMSATIGSRPSTALAKRMPIRPTPPAPITRMGRPASLPTAFFTAPKAVMPEQA